MNKRKRPVRIPLYVTGAERALIEEKMEQIGTKNMNAYLRKMAIQGYVLKLDLPELKEMISLLRRMSNNLNQLTKRVNETGRMYDADLMDIQQQQDILWQNMKDLLTRLASLN
jgi:Bacterial mobilisation protein (MobC).